MEALLALLPRKMEGQPHTYLCDGSPLGPTSAGQYQLNHTSLRIGTATRPIHNTNNVSWKELVFKGTPWGVMLTIFLVKIQVSLVELESCIFPG